MKQVELGVQVNCADKKGTTALHFAVKAKSEELVRILLDAGADPCAMDQYRRSSLALARSSGGAKQVLLPLLQSKAELDRAQALAKAAAEAQEEQTTSDSAATVKPLGGADGGGGGDEGQGNAECGPGEEGAPAPSSTANGGPGPLPGTTKGCVHVLDLDTAAGTVEAPTGSFRPNPGDHHSPGPAPSTDKDKESAVMGAEPVASS